MPAEFLDEVRGIAGNPQTFEARVTARLGSGSTITNEGKVITSADISAITCTVYDKTTGAAGTSVTITSAAIVTLTTWLRTPLNDATGKNFLHDVPGTNFATANHVYVVVYAVTLTSGAGGETIKWKYKVTTYAAS